MTKLSSDQFVDAVRKGLGRAFFHVRDHGDNGINEALLAACLQDPSPVLGEDTGRAEWLVMLLDQLPDPAEYVRQIADHPWENGSYWDVNQRLEILKHFAARGDFLARRSLHRALEELPFDDEGLVGVQLIEVEGVEGLRQVARAVGERLQEDPSFRPSAMLVEYAAALYGNRAVLDELDVASDEDEAVLEYIDAVIAQHEKDVSAAASQEASDNGPDLEPFGPRCGSPGDGVHLTLHTLHVYLEWERELGPDGLLEVLRRFEEDTVEHHIGAMLVALAEARSAAWAPAMLWLYERTPCVCCREKVVECLLEWNCCPEHIRKEARWDCSPKTRALLESDDE